MRRSYEESASYDQPQNPEESHNARTPHLSYGTGSSDEELRIVLKELGAESVYQALKDALVDMDALMLMTEADLRSLDIPLGLRVKLLAWIRQARTRSGRDGFTCQNGPREAAGAMIGWDMESYDDVLSLQSLQPNLFLDLETGELGRSNGERGAGGDDDALFNILMAKEGRSFMLAATGWSPPLHIVGVSVAEASGIEDFKASLTSSQRKVLFELCERLWNKPRLLPPPAARNGPVNPERQRDGASSSRMDFDGFGRQEDMGSGLRKRVLQERPLIAVFDNICSPSLHRAVCQVFKSPSVWTWGHSSSGAAGLNDTDSVFWKCNQSSLEEHQAIQHLSAVVLDISSHTTGKTLFIQRVYANGHTFGQGGSIHVDETGAENYAAIYYANEEWQPHWMGHTLYFPGDAETIRDAPDQLDVALAVLPKPLRLALHDGRQAHLGSAPHRSFRGLRVTLAWKFGVME